MKYVKLFFVWAIIFPILSVAVCYAQDGVKVLDGATSHGCVYRKPSNFLVGLKKKNAGKILSFPKEIRAITQKINSIKLELRGLKGRSNAKSKALTKKLKKLLANNKILKSSMLSCRDGLLAQSIGSLCPSSVAEGVACDDGNPCTSGDRCIAGVCVGNASLPRATISCGFGACAASVRQCFEGKFTACFSGAAGEELCNFLDDDCNGAVDENGACNQLRPTPTPQVNPLATATSIPVATATTAPLPTITSTATKTATPSSTPTKTATATATIPPCVPAGGTTTGTFPFGAGNDSNTCLDTLRARCCSSIAAAGSSCSCINNPLPNTCVGSVTCAP